VQGRREFEDRLNGALETARRDGSLVAVIVGELLGLLVVNSKFGLDAGADAVRSASARLEEAVHGYADFVARIGESEFAVLLARVRDRGDAERVMSRIAEAFEAPFEVRGEQLSMSLAMSANIGPGRRRTDIDLLWRTAEESNQVRSALLQRLVSDVRGTNTTLDEVAQAFVDEGTRRFGFDACLIQLGERIWQAPSALPDREPDASLPLRTEGRTIGELRWWGAVPDETDVAPVQMLLTHVAAALDRAAAVDDADQRARTDPLTGLLNREGLSRELADLRGSYAVGVLDLDHFKRINDEHGHDVGDVVLAELSTLLQRGRSDDLVARWGGEEIVVVMPETTVDGAVARLQRLLEETRSFVRVGDVGAITFSAGVTASAADEPFADAIRRADEAMYRAKRAGRARVEPA
jgi:diguanylate cyclase (GGDEF)-like protein